MALNKPRPPLIQEPTPFATEVIAQLSSKFSLLNQENQYGSWAIQVSPADYFSVVSDLKSRHHFTMLTDLCGVHYVEPEPVLAVVAHLHHLPERSRVFVSVHLPMDDPSIDSLVSLYDAANWMERETYDFFGIIFKGHPNLVRILNEDSMTVFPLRKGFPLEDATREDKDDRMFGR